MPLWDALKIMGDRDSDKLIYLHLPPAAVDRVIDDGPVQAGRHYIRLRLAEMYLKKRVEWFQSWYPAVHSLVRFDFGSQRVEIPFIADASRLAIQRTGAEDIVARNFVLTPAVPFNGGTVDLDAGLIAIKGQNYLNSFIQILGGFANVLAVPQLSAVLNIAQPLANGIQDLFGSVDKHLHLGLHESFAANELVPGYIAVIRAPEREVDVARLCVVEERLRLGTNGASVPFEAYDHMLLRLECFEQRDDWESLTEIWRPFQDARRSLKDLEEDKAAFHLRTALARALDAPELTTADRRRVVQALKDRFQEDKQTFGLSNAVDDDVSFGGVMRFAPSVEQALERGEVSYADVLMLA